MNCINCYNYIHGYENPFICTCGVTYYFDRNNFLYCLDFFIDDNLNCLKQRYDAAPKYSCTYSFHYNELEICIRGLSEDDDEYHLFKTNKENIMLITKRFIKNKFYL